MTADQRNALHRLRGRSHFMAGEALHHLLPDARLSGDTQARALATAAHQALSALNSFVAERAVAAEADGEEA